MLLNLIMRIGVRRRVSLVLAPQQLNRETVEQFLFENGARWAARRDVVSRAVFGVVQVIEVIGQPAGDVEIVASFDEFNLNVRVRYPGSPSSFPKRDPPPARSSRATRESGGLRAICCARLSWCSPTMCSSMVPFDTSR